MNEWLTRVYEVMATNPVNSVIWEANPNLLVWPQVTQQRYEKMDEGYDAVHTVWNKAGI